MDYTIRPSAVSPISFQGDRKEKVSNGMAYGGGAGAVTLTTISKSSKIGNSLVNVVKNSKHIKADKQAKLLELLTNTRFAKFAKNPFVVKGAGILAGMSALTSLVGSTAKIADTYGYLSSQNPAQ